jgi:hypothetical protein
MAVCMEEKNPVFLLKLVILFDTRNSFTGDLSRYPLKLCG